MKREVCLLWLGMTLGARRVNALLSEESDAEKLYAEISEGERLSDEERTRLAKVSISECERLVSRAEELGQSIVCIGDEDYPERLKALDDAPALLFYGGDIGMLKDGTVLHAVGTRTPSRYTESLVRVLCADLAIRGFVLSSGFAEGADEQVIRTALERGGKALVVYPASIESEYPKGGSELKEQLAESGLILSEYPPESRAKMNFRRRNKLAVTLSSAVIITEASSDSKGLDNAERAAELGRPVLAVPPHLLYSKRYFGQRDLLRSGAHAVFDGEDVVRVLAEQGEIAKGSHGLDPNKTGAVRKDGTVHKSSNAFSRELTEDERAVCRLLQEHGTLMLDEISAKSGISMMDVLVVITGLELDGIVISLPGKRYRLDS